jgi:hypothetical protein
VVLEEALLGRDLKPEAQAKESTGSFACASGFKANERHLDGSGGKWLNYAVYNPFLLDATDSGSE